MPETKVEEVYGRNATYCAEVTAGGGKWVGVDVGDEAVLDRVVGIFENGAYDLTEVPPACGGDVNEFCEIKEILKYGGKGLTQEVLQIKRLELAGWKCGSG